MTASLTPHQGPASGPLVLRVLNACERHGLIHQADRLARLSVICRRPVRSSADLTAAEALAIARELEGKSHASH